MDLNTNPELADSVSATYKSVDVSSKTKPIVIEDNSINDETIKGKNTYKESLLHIPSLAEGFIQDGDYGHILDSVALFSSQNAEKTQNSMTFGPGKKGRKDKIHFEEISIKGHLDEACYENMKTCPLCQGKLHSHGSTQRTLKHMAFPAGLLSLVVTINRFRCPNCGKVYQPEVPFAFEGHNITKNAANTIKRLIDVGETNKRIAKITFINANAVGKVEQKYYEELYTEPDPNDPSKRVLKKLTEYHEHIFIDEFKLGTEEKMAIVVGDSITGEILYMKPTKSKAAVLSFLEYVGPEWLSHVKTLNCDMNADFARTFEKACANIEIVYDRFHIIKNFNDKVISEIRKKIYRMLLAQGDHEGAQSLKGSRFILMSSKETLELKDKLAKEHNAKLDAGEFEESSELLPSPRSTRHKRDNSVEIYKKLISDNEPLFLADLIKEKLKDAYDHRHNVESMRAVIISIINNCRAANESHFTWFANLLEKHIDGIVTYAKHHLTSGTCEGVVNLIKTIKRESYGTADCSKLFLKAKHRSLSYKRNAL